MQLSSRTSYNFKSMGIIFVYVKNTKIYINNTVTNIQQGSDRAYGQQGLVMQEVM